MNINQFKLGIGPMSLEIVDFSLQWSYHNKFPLMIIASRNQADANTGYAFTTKSLSEYVQSHRYYDPELILLCRDHCGPYFGDIDNALSIDDAMENCFKTIDEDLKNNFQLIHIDVSRIPYEYQKEASYKLFNYTLDKKSNVIFEYGSEDNSIENLDKVISVLETQLKIIEPYRDLVKFIVSRTGSLTKHTQVGCFNVDDNSKIANLIHQAGYLFKEHNADYLNIDDIKLREHAGVDALNVAPQLGCIQSKVLYMLGKNKIELDKFINLVLEKSFWKKWCTSDINDIETKFISAAHYSFDSKECRDLRNSLNNEIFLETLKNEVWKILDTYRLGFKL